MPMKKLEELNKWKKYDVKVEFKKLRGKDYQMIVYFDNEVVYATRKNTFTIVTKTEEKCVGLVSYILGKQTKEEPKSKNVLQWDGKARKRFDNWSKNFRICRKIQDTAQAERIAFQEKVLNE